MRREGGEIATATLSRSERIARLNDRARQAMGLACVAVATEGFQGLTETDQSRVRDLVETYNAFTPDNRLIYKGSEGRWNTSYPPVGKVVEKVFWKIDAYDHDLRFGSEDPANPDLPRRMLTIMLASEY